jgi:hypothetical protein
VTRHEVHAILQAIPQSDGFSYGVRRVTEWASAVAGYEVSSSLTAYRPWDVVLTALAVVAGAVVGRRSDAARGDGRVAELELFWTGACIYCGSYVLLRSYDYRLVFLLLTVPQLVRWAAGRRPLAAVTLVALLVVLWFDEWTSMPGVRLLLNGWSRATAADPSGQSLPVVVLAQYVLFGALVAWLVATAPPLRVRLLPGHRHRNDPGREGIVSGQ